MTMRPFVLLGDRALRIHRERAGRALAAWCLAWDVSLDEVRADCDPARPAEAGGLFAPACRSIAGCAAEPASVAGEAAEAAVRDLLDSLRAALCVPRAAPTPTDEAAMLATGSGALAVTVRWGDARHAFLVAHEDLIPIERERREAPPPVVEADAAVHGTSITLRAELGEVDVDVAALQALAPGDVIRLGAPLSRALDVVDAHGARLCGGHLGAFNGCRALDIVQ